MTSRRMTSPFTGIAFDAMENRDGGFVAENVTNGSHIVVKYDAATDAYMVPARLFAHVKTLTCIEAAERLGVSRSRISSLVKNGTIASFKANGAIMLLERDIVEYSKTRRTGRPKNDR